MVGGVEEREVGGLEGGERKAGDRSLQVCQNSTVIIIFACLF